VGKTVSIGVKVFVSVPRSNEYAGFAHVELLVRANGGPDQQVLVVRMSEIVDMHSSDTSNDLLVRSWDKRWRFWYAAHHYQLGNEKLAEMLIDLSAIPL